MPTYVRAPSATACWNCDRTIEPTVPVTLRGRAGTARTFELCEDCAAAIPPSLAAIAAEAGLALGRGAAARSGR